MSPDAPAAPESPPASAAATETEIASLLGPSRARAWYRRPALWGGVILLVAIALGLWHWQREKAASATPTYITHTVGRGNLTLTVTANGTIQPTRSINIGSELSGTVLKVNVDVNDRVRKGQILVELDPAKLHNQILRSSAALATATAKHAQAATTVMEAKASLARFEEVARLSNGKVPSKAELDTARATLARANAEQTSARASIEDARAALASDKINLSKSKISAPADGVVLTRNVDPGNAVAASLQAVTLFSLAEDLRKLRLWVYVDEADVGVIQAGQHATFTVSAYPGHRFPARVTRVGFGSTITDNVVTYLTYLDVDNADLRLRPGMTATATVTAAQRNDVLLVPNTALRFVPTADAGASAAKGGIIASLIPSRPRGSTRRPAAADARTAAARQVWVLPAGGKSVPVTVAVTPGISDGRMTEIIAGDLQVGMKVITDQKMAVQK